MKNTRKIISFTLLLSIAFIAFGENITNTKSNNIFIKTWNKIKNHKKAIAITVASSGALALIANKALVHKENYPKDIPSNIEQKIVLLSQEEPTKEIKYFHLLKPSNKDITHEVIEKIIKIIKKRTCIPVTISSDSKKERIELTKYFILEVGDKKIAKKGVETWNNFVIKNKDEYHNIKICIMNKQQPEKSLLEHLVNFVN